ncbi:MAG: tripartite tricarboxylate transporter substrate binding protein [Rubrivivax sp.]
MKRRELHRLGLAALLGGAAPALRAQARPAGPGGYPDRPIKLIVPYPAGGIVDAVMRTVTDPLSAELPQRIVVENRAGADGRIGINAAAQAAPDGYTLVAATPIVAVGEHLFPDMPGRSKSFAGLCAIAAPAAVYVAWSGLPARTLQDLIALAAAKPDTLNVANPGSGSSIHLAQELLFERTGMKVTNVTYKGQPPSLIDMAEGRVHFGLISQSLALPLVQQGRLRPLAVNAARRTRSLPEVPTVGEAGFPEALVQSWYGIAAPRGLAAPIQAYLSEQLLQTLAQPAVRSKLDGMDADFMGLGAAAFDALIESEARRWGELIRKRGIKAAST